MPEMPRSNLIKLLAILFVIFVGLGWAVSSVFSKYNSKAQNNTHQETVRDDEVEESFQGTITYLDPLFNPGENISFSLNDALGNEIILLKSEDQKLAVSEGHFVTVYGIKRKTSAGSDYLLVERVVLKNGAN